jgi:hypothetical protein
MGQVCDAGMCREANSNTCVDTCGGGRLCQAGMCACPVGQMFCAGACVDVQTSDEHCGACNAKCEGGQVCTGGACACAAPQMACGTECADLQTSLSHCGMCDHACTQGDACTAGRCAGPTGDDGCTGEALGVSIAEVAAYQSIKIPIAEGQQAIARASRVADVVQGRQTLVRVFVDVDAGFVGRELSARLRLVNTAGEQTYFAKQTIDGSSNDEDTSSTFQLFVPPEEIQEGTRYAVEVVECTASGTGTVRTPRFPATGDAPLEARPTGVLRIAFVPVQVNGMLPDVSEEALEVYRAYLAAMYPAQEVELSVVDSIDTSGGVDWGGTLERVRSRRESDGPENDVYYYGLLKPAASMREFCGGGCTAGIGYVGDERFAGTRAAIGLAFADESSAEIMAHEVGHNHGRNHAPCAPGGFIDGVDGQYPHDGAALGVWGYDNRSRELLSPDESTDIMGYCDQQWVSDYTYKGFIERIAALNGLPRRIVAPERVAAWQVMLIDGQGERWSLPFKKEGEAYGEPELAEVLGAQGELVDYVTVYRTEISDGGGSIVLVPPPLADWHFIAVQGVSPLSYFQPSSVPEP